MKFFFTLALVVAALTSQTAQASHKPNDVDAEWTCKQGDTQAVVYVKVDNRSADGTYLEQPAEAKIVVIGLHPRRTLMNETVEVAFTKFAGGSAHIQADGLFIGQLFDNTQRITNRNGELVYQASSKSCLN